MNRRIALLVSALALAATAPAHATFGTSWWGASSSGSSSTSSSSAGHVHYCGCGHSGYVAPGCNGGGGTSGGWGGSSGNPGGGNPGGGNPGGGNPGGGNPGTNVPEPADFALFAMGVAGLLIGRRSARKCVQPTE